MHPLKMPKPAVSRCHLVDDGILHLTLIAARIPSSLYHFRLSGTHGAGYWAEEGLATLLGLRHHRTTVGQPIGRPLRALWRSEGKFEDGLCRTHRLLAFPTMATQTSDCPLKHAGVRCPLPGRVLARFAHVIRTDRSTRTRTTSLVARLLASSRGELRRRCRDGTS